MIIEEYVRFVAVNATPTALTTKEIEQASVTDEELSNLRKSIRFNTWHVRKNKQYILVKEELSNWKIGSKGDKNINTIRFER